MLIPDIFFDEQTSATNTINSNVRNRIGIVGQFSKGPVNQFDFINDYTYFSQRYGSDTSPGSLALQAAFDQGATDFGVVRVLGTPRSAKGSVTFSGIASHPNTLVMTLKYVGQVVPRYGTVLRTPISTTGSYSGTLTGRYYFYVYQVTGTVYQVKYQFVTIDDAPVLSSAVSINWSTVSTSFTVDTSSDAGIAKSVANGLSLIFGTSNGDPLKLALSQEWTVRVDSFLYQIPIFQNSTPSQTATSFINVMSGSTPLLDVARNISDNGATFTADSNYEGSLGNGISYYFDLATPDAIVIDTATYDRGAAPARITISPSKAAYVSTGATITATTNVIPANTTVTSVDTTTGVLTLSASLVSNAGAGSSAVRIVNPSGLSVTSFTAAGTSFLTGGEDGPRSSQLELYTLSGFPLLRFLAASPGSWGNSLSVSIYPLTASSFTITASDANGEKYNPVLAPETYTIDLSESGALDDQGFLTALQGSAHIRGLFLPKYFSPDNYDAALLNSSPQRVAPIDSTVTDANSVYHVSHYGPAYLQSLPLTGGYDGPALTDNDYVKAIDVLADYPVHFILAAGQYKSLAIKQRLVAQAETAHELEGLRIAILNARPGLTPLQAKNETAGIDSARAVMITGWSTYTGQNSISRFSLAPDALYAGKLAVLPVEASPAARTTAGPVLSIYECDTKFNSRSSLQIYTDARLEVLTLDPTQSGFYFLSGRTLSSGSDFNKVSIRRVYDLIRGDLFLNLQQYKSQTNTINLRSRIASSINAYLSTLVRSGKISAYDPTVIDTSNNSQEDLIANRLNIQVSFLPLYATDYIYVTIVRSSNGSVQLGS